MKPGRRHNGNGSRVNNANIDDKNITEVYNTLQRCVIFDLEINTLGFYKVGDLML